MECPGPFIDIFKIFVSYLSYDKLVKLIIKLFFFYHGGQGASQSQDDLPKPKPKEEKAESKTKTEEATPVDTRTESQKQVKFNSYLTQTCAFLGDVVKPAFRLYVFC